MTTTTVDVGTISPIGHQEAMRLQEVELDRAIAVLRSLDGEGWTASTDCTGWDVRTLYLHVLGACEAGASVRENLHQMRLAMVHRRRHGGPLEAALTNVQVRERVALTPEEVVDRFATVAPKTVRGRTRLPAILRRHATLAVYGPVVEKWKLGYLVDTIYLRDLWMHRIDLARAVGGEFEVTAEHDGRIIADVVAEWARRHGRPFHLELTGAAGGVYADRPASLDAEHLSLDAVEFARTLGGRAPATGLLATVVPF
jgi:uncharacterized protein (TIGR03083 family)